MKRQVKLISVSGAARRLELSGERVRQLADRGELPVTKTESGQRLFELDDVETLRLRRLASPPRPGGRPAKAA